MPNDEVNALHSEAFGHRLLDERLIAADEAGAAGCEWLHVDFEDELWPVLFLERRPRRG
jgi:hypothetical protein